MSIKIKTYLLLLATFVAFSCNSQNSGEQASVSSTELPLFIQGTVKSDYPEKVYLERMNERNIAIRIDSVELGADRKFEFDVTIPEPGIYQVNIDDQQIVGLILDGGESLTITADGEAQVDQTPAYTLEGSERINQFNAVLNEAQNFAQLRGSLEEEFKTANAKKQAELRQQYQMSYNNHRETIRPLIAEMGTSLAGIIAANNFLNPELDSDYMNQLKDQLIAEGKNHQFAQLFIQTVNQQSVGTEGSMAPDFELTNLAGETIKLSELRGKTVILDFWATWCGPCIRSFPGMKQAVDKYANNEDVQFLFINTFERVGEGQWKDHVKSFVDKRGYNYLNPPLDLGNATALAYGVEGIPAKFCIGPDGKIKHKSTGFLGSSQAVYEEMVEWIESE
ncbi:redoxin domain-containing protein [Jiulongibacter sp. NS-SX5]|uniref:redoxin domain-containing protein n=1 Tax=Jiulongibacter sp. NS-SX5 TaxID=3463854 RepID=UPI00405988D8